MNSINILCYKLSRNKYEIYHQKWKIDIIKELKQSLSNITFDPKKIGARK
jgi:hypothetical protein